MPLGTGQDSTHRFLRVSDLRQLRHLFFSSKRVVEGQYAGRHASPQRGHSVEFNDYREYTPGDPLSDVDWKIYGRSDKFFIKLFEHQSDMTVNLVIDGSASMAYAGDGRETKYDFACRLAAAIAFLTLKQQDKVSLSIACNGLERFIRSAGSYAHLNQILQAMEEQQPQQQGDLPRALRDLPARISRKGLVIVFSDLLTADSDELIKTTGALTHRGNELIIFHLLDPDEIELPDLSDVTFIDSETRSRLRMNLDDVRADYAKRVQRFISRYRSAFKARGVDYNLVSTTKPYHETLRNYLFDRASMM